MQKVRTGVCPYCELPLGPSEPYVHRVCQILKLESPGQPEPGPWAEEEGEREIAVLAQKPWQPSSGYLGISSIAVLKGWSARKVWGRIKAQGVPVSHQQHHAVLSLPQVEVLCDPSAVSEAIVFVDGSLKVIARAAGRETGYNKRSVEKALEKGAVSGLIMSGLWRVDWDAWLGYVAEGAPGRVV